MRQEFNHKDLDARLLFASTLCASLTFVLVILIQLGIASGFKSIGGFGENLIPMAEESAFVFILIAISITLTNKNLLSLYASKILVFIQIAVLFIAVLTLVDIATNYQYDLSDFIKKSPVKMSYLTAFCFILIASGQLLALKGKKQWAVLFYFIVLITAYFILMGYSYGTPLMYNSGYTPMAWPTSIGFILISASLIFGAGKDQIPFKYFIGNSTRALMMRKLIPIIFIIIAARHILDIYTINNTTSNAALVTGIFDIIKMVLIGMVILVVSKKVGNQIDQNIADLEIARDKVSQLAYAVEQSPVAIVITNLFGEIQYSNQKFSEVSGYSKEELMGKNPKVLKSGHTSDIEYKLLWESISKGKSWSGEFHNKRKDGTYYWEAATIYPIKNKEDEVIQYLAIKADITEEKKTKEKLSNIAWQQSHQIRGPLTSIMGIIGVINMSNTIDEKMNLLNSLDEAAKKLDTAIRSIVNETQN